MKVDKMNNYKVLRVVYITPFIVIKIEVVMN